MNDKPLTNDMGTLFIVATPIGNLKDITLRAIDVLSSVDYVLCEDTRVTGRLLNHYEISKKMVSFNEFNEESRIKATINDLAKDQKIALVSDAGTPLISDPGYKLVREAIAAGVKVESIPGPSSVLNALTVSGLPPDKFLFLGYLPKKDGKRRNLLEDAKETKIKSTIIFFESPFRLVETLKNMLEIFGDIDIVVCRELTKIHEEVRREKVFESINHFESHEPRGEFVILL